MNTVTDTMRLTRPREGRMLAGVCEGIARYTGVDATLVRLAFVIATLCGLAGVLIYVAAWVLIPSPETRVRGPIDHAPGFGASTEDA